MSDIRCENCKHYVATRSTNGICCYSMLFAAPVMASDWCEVYEAKIQKESQL